MPVIVFDFDKTLTQKDTVLGFLSATSDKGFMPVRRLVFLFFSVLHKFRFISNDRLKEAGIRLFLKNMEESMVKKSAAVYSKGIPLSNIYTTEFVAKYPRAIIATASYEDYVRPLFKDNLVLAAKLGFKDGKVSGLKQNAFGPQKVKLLNEQGINTVDILYTDSFSDRALMNISTIVYLVKNDNIKKIKG